MKSSSEVKARARKLRDALSGMGHQLKHSESLEVVAKIEGYPDWNTYSADLAKAQQTQYSGDESSETKATSPGHPIIDAIKLDDKDLLKESLSSDVLSNKSIIAEAFYQSVVLERVSLAEILIEQGADVGAVVIRELSLFEFVIHTEREDYLKMLVYKFKHLKGMHPESSKVLPQVILIAGKGVDVTEPVKILLDQGANINALASGDETAIILAGWVRDDLKLVTLLVERGADINIANDNGDTPLIDAAYKGNIEILEYLLKNGADISFKNKAGFSALDTAQKRGNSEAAEIITKYKAQRTDCSRETY